MVDYFDLIGEFKSDKVFSVLNRLNNGIQGEIMLGSISNLDEKELKEIYEQLTNELCINCKEQEGEYKTDDGYKLCEFCYERLLEKCRE